LVQNEQQYTNRDRELKTKAANLATQAEKKIKKALLDIQMNYESRIY